MSHVLIELPEEFLRQWHVVEADVPGFTEPLLERFPQCGHRSHLIDAVFEDFLLTRERLLPIFKKCLVTWRVAIHTPSSKLCLRLFWNRQIMAVNTDQSIKVGVGIELPR